MSEPAPITAEEVVPLEASKTAKDSKKQSSHPKTADMVNAAIKNLKEKNGSSLQAIKKYISANYKVDTEKMAPFIRKYLKAAVLSGFLVQTSGNGATGSFKMGKSEKIAKKVKPKAEETENVKTKKEKVSSPNEKPTKKKAIKEKTNKMKHIPDSSKTIESQQPFDEQSLKAAANEFPIDATNVASSQRKQKASKTVTSSPSMSKKKGKSPMKNPKVPKPKKAQKPKSQKKDSP